MAEPDPDPAFEAAQPELLRMADALQRFAGKHGAPMASCSFCDRSQDEVAAMVEGAHARICDACLKAALALVNQA